MAEEEDPNAKAEREAQELLLRLEIAKRVSDDEFTEMLNLEKWFEDKIAMLKARASQLFKRGLIEQSATLYTRAIGMHACRGEPASHTCLLYTSPSPRDS